MAACLPLNPPGSIKQPWGDVFLDAHDRIRPFAEMFRIDAVLLEQANHLRICEDDALHKPEDAADALLNNRVFVALDKGRLGSRRTFEFC